jgi:Ala-tRNA(Pro) deacylase
MNQQEMVYEKLKGLGITYEAFNHPPVYTIEEMEALKLDEKGDIAKNLFLRDDKGKNHFLVVVGKDKKVDLKTLREQLGTSKLGFASEERLDKYLGLTKGAVTPFGVINDKDCAVVVVIDKDMINSKKIGVHPNDNTATIFLSFEGLKKVIENNGNKILYTDFI